MGAKTRTFVLAMACKVVFGGIAIAAPITTAMPIEHARFNDPDAVSKPLVLTSHEFASFAPVSVASPIPLPTSLALIGSSLLVLALVGGTL